AVRTTWPPRSIRPATFCWALEKKHIRIICQSACLYGRKAASRGPPIPLSLHVNPSEPSRRRSARMKPVRKAIFPVAGLGTRFLPATKAIPKEMLPVVDKPLIQYAVEEAKAAGIEQFIFVTGRGKGAMEDHFDLAIELN